MLQAKQCEMINQLPQGKAIVLNGENNQKSVFTRVTCRYYTHVFISPEIALFKKFEKYILDQQFFINRICLFAINEIHLVDKWGKIFAQYMWKLKKFKRNSLATSLSFEYQQQ